jgi:hypothetical protein
MARIVRPADHGTHFINDNVVDLLHYVGQGTLLVAHSLDSYEEEPTIIHYIHSELMAVLHDEQGQGLIEE